MPHSVQETDVVVVVGGVVVVVLVVVVVVVRFVYCAETFPAR